MKFFRNTTRSFLLAAACLIVTASTARAQEAEPQGITQVPFVCDENGSGTGGSTFVNTKGHFSLQLSISDSSQVVVGSMFKNVADQPFNQIAISFSGQNKSSFGPFLVMTYKPPKSKLTGRVVPLSQAVSGTDEKGNSIATFTPQSLELPAGTLIQSLQIMAIGENAAGATTINDVTINGAVAGKGLTTLNSCDYVF